jgi:predicted membrane chloride channel (bestrophin family)
VFPFCVLNVGLVLFLHWLNTTFEGTYNIEISTLGHTLTTLVVSFLLVSRVNMALSRFWEARNALGIMYRQHRELVQSMIVFSNHVEDKAAKEWRLEVAYRSAILLKVVMAVMEYPSTGVLAWDIPELTGQEEQYVRNSSLVLSARARRWAHEQRSAWEETMRTPIQLAYLLRKSIHSQQKRLRVPLVAAQEMKLLASVESFMEGYYGIRKFMTTPVPFPLIQMSRTFVFLYLFTIPFVLMQDQSSLFAHCTTAAIMTYGFLGLEMTAIELDDPFGNDDNDFDNEAMANTAYEDTYLTLLDMDGEVWVDKLRARMHDRSTEGQRSIAREQSWLLEDVV